MKRFIILVFGLAFHSYMFAQCVPGLAYFSDEETRSIIGLELGSFVFTGVLVNNINEDGKLYVLTNSFPFMFCDVVNGSSSGVPNGNHLENIAIVWYTSTGGSGSVVIKTGATVLFNGQSSTLGKTSIALLELDSPPPYSVVPYLGVKFGDDGQDCIAQHYVTNGGTIKRRLHVKSKTKGFAAVDCEDETDLTYTFSNSTNGVKVTEWGGLYYSGAEYGNGNLNQNDVSKGAPLLNEDKQVTSLYVTKTNTNTCHKDDAYFTKQFPPEILNILGSTNIRAIKIAPCVEEEIEDAIISSSKTTKASIRVIGKSKIDNVAVTFSAGTEVILENGFESGNEFIAEIKPCISQITPLSKTADETEIIAENKVEEKIIDVSKDVSAYPTVLIDNQITLESEGLNYVQYFLTDLQGKVLLKDNLHIENKKSTSKIDLPNLSSGIYLLYVNDGQYSKTIKLIKE